MATEITSKDNAVVKNAAKLMKNAKERRNSGRFIVEGVRLCEEAIENAACIHEVLFTEECLQKNERLINQLEKVSENSYQITDEASRKISDTVTPQGLFVVGQITENEIDLQNTRPDGQFILLENVQDPSNIGSVFRTAEALGLSGVFLSGDCCDPYNPKAMRAAMGAVFRMPFLVCGDHIELLSAAKKMGMRPVAALPEGDATQITAMRFFKGVIMCVGNEGSGLSEGLREICGERVTIPMNGRAESLNAATAAAILMWEMVRNY
ncbi:MAG: RNA methyltransferase [Oscillospiraceae bacterium]|nr:RNA methyltransferase [Oscillospiraceae bacterium]